MKELAIGETGYYFGKKVKCVPYAGCNRCAFYDKNVVPCRPYGYCMSTARTDGQSVMYALPETCTWTQDADGIWYTSCGQAQEFTTGTLEENGYRFCPYCGNGIKEVGHEKE